MNNLNIYLAMAFMFATFKTTSCDVKDVKKQLTDQLTEKELEIYQNIVNERRMIYFMGLGVGLGMATLFLYTNPNMSALNKITSAIAIVGSINYFFYILYPKSQYMIQHLDTKSENTAWLNMYKTMQFRYHLGFVLGLAGAYFYINHVVRM